MPGAVIPGALWSLGTVHPGMEGMLDSDRNLCHWHPVLAPRPGRAWGQGQGHCCDSAARRLRAGKDLPALPGKGNKKYFCSFTRDVKYGKIFVFVCGAIAVLQPCYSDPALGLATLSSFCKALFTFGWFQPSQATTSPQANSSTQRGAGAAQRYKANSPGTAPHPTVTLQEAAQDEDGGAEPGAGPTLLAACRGWSCRAGQEQGDMQHPGEGSVVSGHQGGGRSSI